MLAYQITKLPDTRLKVVKPIPCTCRGPSHGYFTAQARTLEQVGCGDTLLEAMNNLVANIVIEYDECRRTGKTTGVPGQEHIEFLDHIEAQYWKAR